MVLRSSSKAIWEALVGEFPNLTQRQVRLFIDAFDRAWTCLAAERARRGNRDGDPLANPEQCQVFPSIA